MAAPTNYARSFGFANYAASAPTRPLPGIRIDAELDNIAASTSSLAQALGDVRATDGRLKNGIVGYDTLAPGLVDDLATAAAQAASAAADFKDYAALAASTRTFATGTVVVVDGYRYEAQPVVTANGDLYSTTNAFYLMSVGNTFYLDGLGLAFGINGPDWAAPILRLYERVKGRNKLVLAFPAGKLRCLQRLLFSTTTSGEELILIGDGCDLIFDATATNGGLGIDIYSVGMRVEIHGFTILSRKAYANGGTVFAGAFGARRRAVANHGDGLSVRRMASASGEAFIQALVQNVRVDYYSTTEGGWNRCAYFEGVTRPTVLECFFRSKPSWWTKEHDQFDSAGNPLQDFYGPACVEVRDAYAPTLRGCKLAGPFEVGILVNAYESPFGTGSYGSEGGFFLDNEVAGIPYIGCAVQYWHPDYAQDRPMRAEPAFTWYGGHCKGMWRSFRLRNIVNFKIVAVDTVSYTPIAEMGWFPNQTIFDLDFCGDGHIAQVTNESHGYYVSDTECTRMFHLGEHARNIYITGVHMVNKGIGVVTDMDTDSLYISNSPFNGAQVSDDRSEIRCAIPVLSTNGCRPTIDGVKVATGTVVLEFGGVATDAAVVSDITVFHDGTTIRGDLTFELTTANTRVGSLVIKSDLLPPPAVYPDGSAWVTDVYGVPEAAGSQFSAVVSGSGLQIRSPQLGISATPKWTSVQVDDTAFVAGTRFRIGFCYDCGAYPGGHWITF